MNCQILLMEQRINKTWRKVKSRPEKDQCWIGDKNLFVLGQKELELIHESVEELNADDRRTWEIFIFQRNLLTIHDLAYYGIDNYNPRKDVQRTREIHQIMEDLGNFTPIGGKLLFEYLDASDGIINISNSDFEKSDPDGEIYWELYGNSMLNDTTRSFNGTKKKEIHDFSTFNDNIKQEPQHNRYTGDKFIDTALTPRYNSGIRVEHNTARIMKYSKISNENRVIKKSSSSSKLNFVQPDIIAKLVSLKKKWEELRNTSSSSAERYTPTVTNKISYSNDIKISKSRSNCRLLSSKDWEYYDENVSSYHENAVDEKVQALPILDTTFAETKLPNNSLVFNTNAIDEHPSKICNLESTTLVDNSTNNVGGNTIGNVSSTDKPSREVNANNKLCNDKMNVHTKAFNVNIGSIAEKLNRYIQEVAKLEHNSDHCVKFNSSDEADRFLESTEPQNIKITNKEQTVNDLGYSSTTHYNLELTQSDLPQATLVTECCRTSIESDNFTDDKPATYCIAKLNGNSYTRVGNADNMTIDAIDGTNDDFPGNPSQDISIDTAANVIDITGCFVPDVISTSTKNIVEQLHDEIPYRFIADLPAFVGEDDNIARLMVTYFPFIRIIPSRQIGSISIKYNGHNLEDQTAIGYEILKVLDQCDLSSVGTLIAVCKTSQTDESVKSLEEQFPFRVWFVPSKHDGYIDWKYKGHNEIEKNMIGKELKKAIAKYKSQSYFKKKLLMAL